jgi:hypothetical protein
VKARSAIAARQPQSHAAPPARAAAARASLGLSNSVVQAKLAVGPVDDPLEREADRVAEAVIGGRLAPPIAPGSPPVQRKCDACEEEETAVRRKEDAGGSSAAQGAPPAVQSVLRAPGQPLDAATRRYFEPRFGRDFGEVRVHTGGDAERSAQQIGARAYTAGSDIVFGSREYAPRTQDGRELLAHELTHVLQQRGSPARVSRAPIKVGNVAAQSDYKDVAKVPPKGQLAAIKKKHLAYVKAPLDPAVETQITAFSDPQQKWLLYGLDLLLDNDKLAPGLDHAKAEQALVAQAPSSTTTPAAAPADAFEQEVFLVSGWSEEAISGAFAVPTFADMAVTDPLYNPPPAAISKKFDRANFIKDLSFATKYKILGSRSDPSNWQAGPRAQPIADVKSVGDVVQDQARMVFSPYVETAQGNRFAAGWKYSSAIHSVTTDAAGQKRTVGAVEREELLRNRTEGVGRDSKKGRSIFDRTNYDPDKNQEAFDWVVNDILKDSIFSSVLDDEARHTGHLERPSLEVAVSTEVDAGIPECTTRWLTVRTLCHELMHSFAHPAFIAAESSTKRFPKGVTFSQVLVEGFAEVLGVQLFAHLLSAATPSSKLLAGLTQGVSGTCNAPAVTPKIGYDDAGANAEQIRVQIGDDRFRAAYFHGRTALAGL